MKNWLLITLLLGLGLGGFYFWLKLSETTEDKAFLYFIENEFESARSQISRTQITKKHPFSVYSALIASSKGDFQQSEMHLSAIGTYQLSEQERVCCELLHFFNAAAENDLVKLRLTKQTCSKELMFHPLKSFFIGYVDYLDGDFSSACSLWENQNIPIAHSKGPMRWIQHLVEKTFSSQFRELCFAHALIEIGHFDQAHTLLEKQCFSSESYSFSSIQQVANALLGLNHLREGILSNTLRQESHFKLAHFYLGRGIQLRTYPYIKERLQYYFVDSILTLALNPTESNSIPWAIQFLQILNSCNETKWINLMALKTVNQLENCNENEPFAFLESAAHFLYQTPFHNACISHLKQGFDLALEQHDLEAMKRYANWLIKSDCDFDTIHALFSSSSCALPRFIEREDDQLFKVHSLISFWNALPLDERYTSLYSEILLHQAEACWFKEGFEEQGLKLMKCALEQSTDQLKTMKRIEQFLLPLYENAENNNTLARLAKVHDALEAFQIQPLGIELSNQEKIANHLADAHYLLSKKNWFAAKTHANWVLKLQPQNSQALRIAGLSAFYLGERALAYSLLSKIQERDKAICYALAFSTPYMDCSNITPHIVQSDQDHFEEAQ